MGCLSTGSEMNEAISTVLIAVVGLILVLLFIVFLLAVIFLRARRDVYPPSSRPAHGVVPPKYVSAMFEYDSQNMTLPYSDSMYTYPHVSNPFSSYHTVKMIWTEIKLARTRVISGVIKKCLI